jgi:hypothetical protein
MTWYVFEYCCLLTVGTKQQEKTQHVARGQDLL